QMRISNIVDILILVISLIGISSLYLTESVNLLFLIIFTFSTFPVFVSILTVKKYFVHSGTSSILAVITVGYLIFDIFFLNNEVVYALINFLVLIHAVKLISNKKIRDYQQIVLLSFLQILASSILTTKFIFGVFLLLYLVFGLLTLIVLNIKKEKLNANNSSDAKVDIYSLIKFEILIIVVVLVTTTSFFLILPRFNAGFLSGLFIKPNSIRSGFSEKVELGRVGVIKSDNSPVMRVKILNKDKPDIKGPIYWRGLALDEFDGKSWSVSRNNSKSIVKANRYGSIVVRNYDIANENEFLKQEIITEPIDTDILFAAEKPVSFSRMPNLKMVVTNNSYLMIGSRKNRVKYLSYSNINKPNKNLLRSEKWDIPSDIKFNYSKPKGLSSSFNDLVEELKDENSSYYENIINVRDYILRNYEYTRTLRSSDEVYPLDDFLFK
ncbi:MAG: DUF3488 domain-containing protein, partial [Candidatus Dadabacteria bacterium]|nr:DUF3488 domain-containing protein [Candidatus Dadabacteria bacterium]NIQ16378.1 DUF3488 domain-containing protein [Candidatus Dadabacteria bacterium]